MQASRRELFLTDRRRCLLTSLLCWHGICKQRQAMDRKKRRWIGRFLRWNVKSVLMHEKSRPIRKLEVQEGSWSLLTLSKRSRGNGDEGVDESNGYNKDNIKRTCHVISFSPTEPVYLVPAISSPRPSLPSLLRLSLPAFLQKCQYQL